MAHLPAAHSRRALARAFLGRWSSSCPSTSRRTRSSCAAWAAGSAGAARSCLKTALAVVSCMLPVGGYIQSCALCVACSVKQLEFSRHRRSPKRKEFFLELPLLSKSVQFSNLCFNFKVEHYKSSITCRFPLFRGSSRGAKSARCELLQFCLGFTTTSYIPSR